MEFLDNSKLIYHDEPIFLDNTYIGNVTSAMFGHRTGKSRGLGYAHQTQGVSTK